MKLNIGFIGCGKMASAIIKGILASEDKELYNIKGAEVNEEFAKLASERLGIEVSADSKNLVNSSDVVFIATKPNNVAEVIENIKNELTPDKLLVSIAAGVNTSKIENIAQNIRVIRIMPNTPALVNLGMFGICKGSKASDNDVELIEKLLSSLGRCIKVEESQMDIVTAISGSSLVLAAQTALGSAQMVFNRGETPVQTLIDNVATKGGCTYVGICEMKEKDSTKMFFDVIDKTTQKANALGKD